MNMDTLLSDRLFKRGRAVVDGDISTGSLMAGQSVGLVNRIMPIKDIIEELVRETEAELQRVHGALMA